MMSPSGYKSMPYLCMVSVYFFFFYLWNETNLALWEAIWLMYHIRVMELSRNVTKSIKA